MSQGAFAQHAAAPRIRSITVSGGSMAETKLNAVADGHLIGDYCVRNTSGQGYVENIGTFDGTSTGRDMDLTTWGELGFNVAAPADGKYSLIVEYASGTTGTAGRWLQVAVGEPESEKRFYDNFVPASANNTTFINSDPIEIELKAGENLIRLMNHRRQENLLVSFSAILDSMNKYNEGNPDYDFRLSLCEWGKAQPHEYGQKIAGSWRILNDITFSTGSPTSHGSASWTGGGTASICSQYNKAVIQDEYAGLDKGWNDPDMMVIGMNGITDKMSETHMTMWCMMNSPIMLGYKLDQVQVGDAIHRVIANKDVIDLNQDPLGIQAKRIYTSADTAGKRPDVRYVTNNNRIDVLAKPLANGDIALSFFNLNTSEPASATVDMDLILEYIGHKMVNANAFRDSPLFFVKDIWTKEVSISGKSFSVTNLPGTDNWTVRVSLCDDPALVVDFLQGQIVAAKAELAAKSAPAFPTPIIATNNTLNTAIGTAQAVCDNTNATVEELSGAINALTTAIQAFNSDYEKLVTLKSTIEMADIVIGNAAKYVQDANWANFAAKLVAAKTVYESRNSAAEIVTATNELVEARGMIKRLLGEAYGPIVWYIFDDPSSTVVKDESGNGKDGMLLDGGQILPGNELRFANAGYVQLPVGILSGEEEFTLAAWVKHYSYNNWARLFDFGMSSSSGYMFVAPSNGSNLLGYAITQTSNNAEQGFTTARPALNQWMHLVVAQEGTTVRMYLNGVQVASRANTTLNPANSIGQATNSFIGKSQWSDPYLNSSIKDVRIYNKPLNVDQINQIMQDFKPVITDTVPVDLTTRVGVAPVLPSQVTVTLDDGSTAGAEVTWDVYDPAQVFMGKTFTITGTITVTTAISNPDDKKAEAIVSFEPIEDISVNPDFIITLDVNDEQDNPFVDYIVINNGDLDDTARFFYAVYDKDTGRLIKVDTKDEQLAADSYAAGRFNVVLPADTDPETIDVKVFLWSGNYTPFIPPLEFKLEPFAEPMWSIIRPTAANATKNSNESITIRTQNGDLWGNSDNNGTARNMYLMDVPNDTKDNFSVTVKVSGFKPSENYHRAALIAYTGDGNQVSVMRRFHSSQGNNVFQTTMNTNGSAAGESQYTTDAASNGNECLLRLDKAGATFTGYFSFDNGATWTQMQAVRTQNNIHNAANIRVGFYASNGTTTATSVPVTFEGFTLNGQLQRFTNTN